MLETSENSSLAKMCPERVGHRNQEKLFQLIVSYFPVLVRKPVFGFCADRDGFLFYEQCRKCALVLFDPYQDVFFCHMLLH